MNLLVLTQHDFIVMIFIQFKYSVKFNMIWLITLLVFGFKINKNIEINFKILNDLEVQSWIFLSNSMYNREPNFWTKLMSFDVSSLKSNLEIPTDISNWKTFDLLGHKFPFTCFSPEFVTYKGNSRYLSNINNFRVSPPRVMI